MQPAWDLPTFAQRQVIGMKSLALTVTKILRRGHAYSRSGSSSSLLKPWSIVKSPQTLVGLRRNHIVARCSQRPTYSLVGQVDI